MIACVPVRNTRSVDRSNLSSSVTCLSAPWVSAIGRFLPEITRRFDRTDQNAGT